MRCGPLMAGALTVAWELQPGVSQLAAQQIIAEHRGGGGTSIASVPQYLLLQLVARGSRYSSVVVAPSYRQAHVWMRL